MPKCCVMSIDLSVQGVNLISTEICSVDFAAPNSLLIATMKDIIHLQLSLSDKSAQSERFHKILSPPGSRQGCMTLISGETVINGIATPRRAVGVAGDSCGVAVIDCEANEFCGALQIGELVTAIHSSFSPELGCTLGVGTAKGNVFVARRFMQEGQKCDQIAKEPKSPIVDLKISPNGLFLIVITKEHNCALYERKEGVNFEFSCLRK